MAMPVWAKSIQYFRTTQYRAEAGTHAITGNFSASATSGTLTVTPSNACGNGPAQSVSVTVHTSSTAPTSASASPSTICVGQSTTLSASGGTNGTGSSLVWYSGSCGGTQVGTGPSIAVSPSSTTTYYVRREGGCGTPTGCASVTVPVNDVPGPSTVSGPTTLCRGQSYTFSTTNNTTSYQLVHHGSAGDNVHWKWAQCYRECRMEHDELYKHLRDSLQ